MRRQPTDKSTKKFRDLFHVTCKVALIEVVVQLFIYYLVMPHVDESLSNTLVGLLNVGLLVIISAPLIAYFVTKPYVLSKHDVIHQLEYQTHHDLLSGLLNRRALILELEKIIQEKSADADKVKFSLLLLDLDKFKQINDTLGHGIGDLLLISVSNRLELHSGERDLVFRLGGDEFAILHEFDDVDSDRKLAENIVKVLCDPHIIGGNEIKVGASIGITELKSHHVEDEFVIRDADIALYRAKYSGIEKVVKFENSMMYEAQRRFMLEQDIYSSIEKNQLYLHYQPIFDLQTKKIVGAEALIRWSHPNYGDISPEEFIPMAEQRGCISAIFEYIIDTVCVFVERNEAKFDDNFRLSVNVSGKQFQYDDVVGVVRHALKKHSVSANRLVFELTESSLVDYGTNVIPSLSALSSIGSLVSLDDFGIGYSSIMSLYKYNFDIVKVDRFFIKDIMDNAKQRVILDAIIYIKNILGIEVIVEGVETEQQHLYISKLSVRYVQGYYYSMPIEGDKLASLLTSAAEMNEIS